MRRQLVLEAWARGFFFPVLCSSPFPSPQMLLLLLLVVSVAHAQEQGHVLSGLGAGVRGNGVLLATAELMRGPGAALLSDATVESVRKDLRKVVAELRKRRKEEGAPKKIVAAKSLRSMDVPLIEPVLKRVIGIVTPRMNDTRTAVHDVIQAVLVFEKDARRSIDSVRAAIAERMKHVRARQAFQVEELMAVDAAVKLDDGMTIRTALGPNATREDFQRVSRKHDRVYQQIMRVHQRLSQGERRAQRVAAQLIADLLINKVAVLESDLSRVVYKMLGVYNQRGHGAEALITYAAERDAEAQEMEEEQARLLSASGALLSAIAVSNERTVSSLARDFLNITNHEAMPTELDEAFELAVARRNARVFVHRAIRTMEALFINNEISKRADMIRRVSAEAAHRLMQAEEIAVRGRLDRRSYFSAKADDFDLAGLVTGKTKKSNLTVAEIDTRDFLNLARQIDLQFEADQILSPFVNASSDEEPIQVGDMEHANRLADNIRRIAGGEAAHLQAEEDFTLGHVRQGFANLALAQKMFSDFLLPRPGPSSYGEQDMENGGKKKKVDAETRRINNIQSSSIIRAVKRKGVPVLWGKFGHHNKLRKRIFRNGVAVDRLWRRKVDTPSRYRMDRLQRALNGANLQFSRDIRRRNSGIMEGEDELAKRILRVNGALEDSTMDRFEDDEELQKRRRNAARRRRKRNAKKNAKKQREELNTAFDVAATGKLSNKKGDVFKVDFSKFEKRQTVGGAEGFNQFVKADSAMGVNRIQGFASQVNQGRSLANVKLSELAAVTKKAGKQMKKTVGRGKKALKAARRAIARQVARTVKQIKALAGNDNLRLSAMVKKTVEQSRQLLGGLRAAVTNSAAGVKAAVADAKTNVVRVVGNANVFLGRAHDAKPGIRDIVKGIDRGGVVGTRDAARGIEQIAAMLPGKIGQRLAQIAFRAEKTVSKQLKTVEQKVAEVANRVGAAGLTVRTVEEVARSLRKGGMKAAFGILRRPRDGAGGGNGRGGPAVPGGAGVTLGIAGQISLTGPVLARELGRAFAPLFNKRANKGCRKWARDGRIGGVVVTDKARIAEQDLKCAPKQPAEFASGSFQNAILAREPCALWHRAGSVRVIGRTCLRLGGEEKKGRPSRLAFTLPTLAPGAVNCSSEGPFFGSPIDAVAKNPTFQCRARTPESIIFALRQIPACMEFQRSGTWTMPQLTPLEQELLGRGLLFENERSGEFNCGPRQPALTKLCEEEFRRTATTTTAANKATVRP